MDKQQLEGDPLMQTYQQLGSGLSHLPGMRNVSLQFILLCRYQVEAGTAATPQIAIAGCGAGLVAAVLASHVLVSFLYEISPHDPWILLFSIALLMAIVNAASLLPALRAARIDPMAAIRCD